MKIPPEMEKVFQFHAYKGTDAPDEPQSPPLQFISPTSWVGQPVPERRWLVRDRIPRGVPSLLNGDGAAGKTTIALQLGVNTIRGTDWLGAVIDEPGPVIFFTAEEDDAEIHRRLDAITAHHGIGLEDLKDFHLLCLPGEDAVLGATDRNDVVRGTKLFQQLEAAACDIRPALIIIEAAADVFAINEINRTQVRQSIGLLRRLGIKSDASVLLLQHPSITGMTSGTGTSGSTHWNNGARSRLYFTGVKTDSDDLDNIRELKVMKSNYGPKGEAVRLRWQRGVFVPEARRGSLEMMAADQKTDDLFLIMLRRFKDQGRNVSDKTSPTHAPTLFAAEREAKAAKATKAAFAEAMSRLFTAGKIKVVTEGSASRQRSHIEEVGGPSNTPSNTPSNAFQHPAHTHPL